MGIFIIVAVTLTSLWLCDQGSLVSLCTRDYKSLCAAVTICSNLVNTQTDLDVHTCIQHLTSLFDKLTQLIELETGIVVGE